MFHNLTRQLTLILATCIFLVATAAILPAYVLIRNELQHQTQQRLEDARRNTRIMLDFEKAQLTSTVTLAAERPTLQRLLRDQDQAALNPYLHDFQQNTDLDYLYVTDATGGYFAGQQPESDEALLISVTVAIPTGGAVNGAIRLDTELADRLQQQTGFTYTFTQTALTSPVSQFEHDLDGQKYYGAMLPLADLTQHPQSVLEILLPVGGIIAAETQVVGLLLLTTLLVTLITALAGGLYIRGQIRPLWNLTRVARRLGEGDLTTPVEIDSRTAEISMLTSVLEKSRVNLATTLKALSEAKEWSESLIRSIHEGIITLDQTGKVVFFSDGAARIMQLKAAEITGKDLNNFLTVTGSSETPFTDFVPPENARRTVNVSSPQREALTLALTRARQPDKGQTTIVLHDITEETQRRSLQAYFLANVSHEFRTPLAGMKVSIELLLENIRFLTSAEVNELLSSLYLSVTTLQSLIDNLLESSRIEANHLTLRRQPCELNHLLGDAVLLVQPFLNRRQQILNLEEPLTLPILNLDPTRLTQVLVNLISNASKYSPMASTIDLTIDHQANELYFAVNDRGQGLPEGQQQDVFKQFVRFSGDSKADHGTGLGLAVVKAIIEAHGGLVGVNPREGGGSVFWFKLPTGESVA
jgi:two-component system sensor histidine kinase VicK